MQVLLSFTGFHDPYNPPDGAGVAQVGPILTVLAHHSFDKVILFSTRKTEGVRQRTSAEIRAKYREVEVVEITLMISDPTNHLGILRQLRKELKVHAPVNGEDHYSISISSGTPHMHACWLLLVASSEFPAKLLQPQKTEFVKPGKSPVQEIQLTASDFPKITTSFNWDQDEPTTDHIYRVASELGIVESSPAFDKVLREAYTLAQYSEHLLLLGETGTGKEKITEFIHSLSARSNRPLEVINCGAIPKDLAESELFGHVKGAFTGAMAPKKGKFKRADQGILFLDEVGDLPLHVQTKLLRVLEQQQIEPIGGNPLQVNVQIIAATHKDIPTMVAEGEFREDLYQRFVSTISLPPLRERREDIPFIAKAILDQWGKEHNKSLRLSPDAIHNLMRHSWPGNVRELRNLIIRSAMFATTDSISSNDLRFQHSQTGALDLPELGDGFEITGFLGNLKKQLIDKALSKAPNNKAEAARLLGWTPQALSNYLNREQKQK